MRLLLDRWRSEAVHHARARPPSFNSRRRPGRVCGNARPGCRRALDSAGHVGVASRSVVPRAEVLAAGVGSSVEPDRAGRLAGRGRAAPRRWCRTSRYPDELPVSQRRDDIAAAIRDHQVVVVAGETGSGKTTQLPEDLPGARPRAVGRRHDRAHPAPPDRRPQRRRADRRGARHRRWATRSATRCGSPTAPRRDTRVKVMTDGILLAELQRDRDAAALRHDHHRRGPRAQPQHRLPARLPQAAAAAPPRPQGRHHLRDDRPASGSPRTSPTPRDARADHRGLRADLPGRGPLPPAASRSPYDDEEGEPSSATRPRRSSTRSSELVARGPRRHPGVPARRAGDPRHRRRAGRPGRRGPPARSRSCRCTRGSPRPSSTGSSSGTPGAASCSPPTSPRRR